MGLLMMYVAVNERLTYLIY